MGTIHPIRSKETIPSMGSKKSRNPGTPPRLLAGPAALVTDELKRRLQRDRKRRQGKFQKILRPPLAAAVCKKLWSLYQNQGIPPLKDLYSHLSGERVFDLIRG